MPATRHKQKTEFSSPQIKAVFLYGHPNCGKQAVLIRMQQVYTDLVNTDIGLIQTQEKRFLLQLIKNDKKDSDVRAFEKSHRPEGLNSAFCQNAFDTAFTKLANRLDAVRLDMFRRHQTIFTQSKVLFAMSVQEQSREAMSAEMKAIASAVKRNKAFYLSMAEQLDDMSPDVFRFHMQSFQDEYAMADMLFAIPHCKKEMAALDSRLMVLEKSRQTVCSHVLTVSNPFGGDRIQIPIHADGDARRRLMQYKMAGTIHMSVTKSGLLRVQVSFQKKVKRPKTGSICGVDTGMKDCFYCSDGRSIGTMDDVIRYYKETVEPAFGELSDLRNKKTKILHYVRTHSLSKEVRSSLLAKADRLEQMLRTADAPYRKKRRYYQMLDAVVSQSVREYISGIDRNTLTVLEKLDIREFHKSRKVNGQLSVFARGLLQKKLMMQLNWHGFDFLEVEPDYSSQTCPVCGNIDSANRRGKEFHCTCCGHTANADYNAAINLKQRAEDTEFLSLCEKEKYHHKAMQRGIKLLWKERNTPWKEQHCYAGGN